MEHVEGDGCMRNFFFRRKGKSRLGIDEAANQPSRCGAVHTGSRPSYPQSGFVVSRVDLWYVGFPAGHSRCIGLREQFRCALLQPTVEEIHLDDLLEAAPQSTETTNGSL